MIQTVQFESDLFSLTRTNPTHKGDWGRVAIIGGSVRMPGAACLSALAAMRVGAGLVTVMSVEALFPMLTLQYPHLMGVGLPMDDNGQLSDLAIEPLLAALTSSRINQVVIGPGLGQSNDLSRLVKAVLAWCQQEKVTCVCDADALNNVPLQEWQSGPVVVTPHPGEFERWAQQESHTDNLARIAKKLRGVVVHKTHQTRVVDGPRCYENQTGNPGMATAGAGDVLTGMVVGLLAQVSDPFMATTAAVYAHGNAGSRSFQTYGMGLTAYDMIADIGPIIRKWSGNE